MLITKKKNLKYNPQCISSNKLVNKSGIYQIRNIINNNFYIGSSCNLYARYCTHFRDLKNNKHGNIHLQNAYNKYGKDNFVFEIIEFCSTSILLIREQEWLNQVVGESYCYNIQKLVAAGFCKDEDKIDYINYLRTKIGKGRKGKTLGKDHPNSRQIICLETNKIYWGSQEAMRNTKICCYSISRCCRKRQKTAGGYHWMFLEDFKKLTTEKIESKLHPINDSLGNYKQVICLETKKVYQSANKASTDTGIGVLGIKKCCKKLVTETQGSHWMYYKEYKNCSEEYINNLLTKHNRLYGTYLCIETNVEYSSLTKAAKDFNTTYQKIKKVCQGKLSDINGYHFKYLKMPQSAESNLVRPVVDGLFGRRKNENK